MRFKNLLGVVLGALPLALAACGESAGPATPAGVAEAVAIDFANVANYAKPQLPAYFDRKVAIRRLDLMLGG